MKIETKGNELSDTEIDNLFEDLPEDKWNRHMWLVELAFQRDMNKQGGKRK